MESATASVTIQDVSPQERAWCKLLVLLTQEEKEILFRGSTELMLHDQFVSGDVSVSDIRMVLAADYGVEREVWE